MKRAEEVLRRAIIQKCRVLSASGLSQGSAGAVSARFEDRMLITPAATPYEALETAMIASTPLAGDGMEWDGPNAPSAEWRLHFGVMKNRADVGAVIHARPPYCTTLAAARKDIPAVHYMMAAFGGPTIRCADYATYGADALSSVALDALGDRSACLLANHGMIAVGENLDKAAWLAAELEMLAREYYNTLLIGGPVVLSDEAVAETAHAFNEHSVGVEKKRSSKAIAKRSAGRTRGGVVKPTTRRRVRS